MDAPLPKAIPDTIGPCMQGIHSGLATTLLPFDQQSFAINIAFRGGYAHTRPVLRKLTTTYADPDVQINLRAAYQGGAFYRTLGSNPSCLVTGVGGRLFRWVITNNNVTVDDITPVKDPDTGLRDINNPNRPQVWMAQGQDFLVVNDGESLPWFFDGGKVWRSAGYAGRQLPVGKMIHYVNGRFVMVLGDLEQQSGGTAYIASDLVYTVNAEGGPGGTVDCNYRDSILYINDNIEILGGRAFAVPVNAGQITSLFSTAVSDTSLGQGPLQVGTEEGVYSVLLPLDATLWTTTQQPQQVVALPNGGPTGFYGVSTVNGDAWYRSGDGLRSFVVARRDFNTWVQTSLSFELERILPYDTRALLNYASAVNFDNRFLCTCSPYQSDGRGVAHRGLVALDFINVSGISSRSQPAYDGLWTGLPILQVIKAKLNGVERCFVFAISALNEICLYELGVEGGGWFDFDGTTDRGIVSTLESGALFGREALPATVKEPQKKLITSDLTLYQLAGASSATPSPGTITFDVSYRSDGYPFWVDWTAFTLCAESCYTPATCAQPLPVQMQYATFKRLPEPSDDTCNELTGRPMRFGYNYQIKLQVEGHFELRDLNTWATRMESTRNTTCEPGTCRVLTGCLDNPFTYVIEPGEGTSGLLEWDVAMDSPTWNVNGGGLINPT